MNIEGMSKRGLKKKEKANNESLYFRKLECQFSKIERFTPISSPIRIKFASPSALLF